MSTRVTTNPHLVLRPGTTPHPERVWMGIAIFATVILQIGAIVLFSVWQIREPRQEFAGTLAPRSFRIHQVERVETTTPPGTRSGGQALEVKPGAATDKAPAPDAGQFERAFSMAMPQASSPSTGRPTLDANPLSALPDASAPTLLPFADGRQSIEVGPSAPVNPFATGASSGKAPAASASVQLPTSLPGSQAIENLPVVEGGGIGTGGVGSGLIPQMSDVDKLVQTDLRDAVSKPEGLVIRLSNELLFDFDSARLRGEAYGVLGKVSAVIARFPGCTITVSGHSDTIGEDAYNQQLSESRARAVGEWLRSKGGSGIAQMGVRGFGATRPLVNPRGSIQEQRPNRRVEILIQAIQQE